MPAKNNNKYIYKINLLNYNNKDRYNFDIKNKICYFYGKGFSFNNEIFLPLIDEQYNITLFSIDKNFKRKRSICLETGLYKIIKKSDNYIYFIGYNYFKDKTKFYFCYFYPNEDKITYLKIN